MRDLRPVWARRLAWSACVLCATAALAAGARGTEVEERDLAEMPIEDLMKIEVTSVARGESSLSESAAAVTVITQDDIRRSGATSIAEALRLVPGLDVARITSSIWGISSRGFNSRFANKMLVLIDGRTVYTPAFGGVLWDVQDTVLEDIDRIEVIRGPGASVWGANAVNGVINITTRSASATKGVLLAATGGSEERDIETVRVGGGASADSVSWRVFAKHFARSPFVRLDGREAADDWHAWRAGFRVDAGAGDRDGLTLQGEAYRGSSTLTSQVVSLVPPAVTIEDDRIPVEGSSFLGRWTRTYSEASDLRLQIYFDRTDRKDVIGERRTTYDIDFQQQLPLGASQDIVWGLGYRRTSGRDRNSFTVSFLPDHRTDRLASGFVQDQVRLSADRWRLVVGSKFEHNPYTGWEVQPTVRVLCKIDERQTAWAAVSRAVRTPARSETSVRAHVDAFPTGPGNGGLVTLFGNPDQDAERMLAYEAGYRTQLSDRISFDAAAFYTHYRGVRTTEQRAPFFETDPPPPHLEIPLVFDNRAKADSKGLEVSGSWRISKRLRLRGWYSFLRLSFHPDAESSDTSNPAGDVPRHQARLWSSVDLPHDLALDASAQFVDRLSGQDVPSYVRGDIRLAWHPTAAFEVEAGVRNLLDRRHKEFIASFEGVEASQIERSWYAGLSWKF